MNLVFACIHCSNLEIFYKEKMPDKEQSCKFCKTRHKTHKQAVHSKQLRRQQDHHQDLESCVQTLFLLVQTNPVKIVGPSE